MQRETIAVNARAQGRLSVLNHVLSSETSAADAATYLGLSLRSVRRLLARYRGEGVAALVHGNAGRVPSNRITPELRARLVELALTTYAGVNRAHLAELPEEREGLVVPARSLRRILAQAGLPPEHRRRPRQHRQRRERMSQAGILLRCAAMCCTRPPRCSRHPKNTHAKWVQERRTCTRPLRVQHPPALRAWHVRGGDCPLT